MFDLPETKRVCRTELFSRSPSPTSASIQQPFEFEFITIDKTPALNASANADDKHRGKENDEGEGGGADIEEFDFPLFTTPKSADGVKKTTQRITIKSPTPPAPEQDLWEVQAKVQKRPESHYLLSRQEMEKRSEEFKAVVLSGEEVLSGAQVKWHGCLLPWKVTHLVTTTTTTPGPTKKPTKKPMIPELSILGADKKKKHSRPGKKRRIHLRIAAQKLKATEEARQKSLAGREKYKGLTKEERDRVEREEKSKRNREKKIKARQRERAKKEAAAATAAAATLVVATKDVEENGGRESVEMNGD